MSVSELKVLNIAQPHAHNTIFKGKNVENRSKACGFRGTIAIYASKTAKDNRFEGNETAKSECSFGAIIELVDIVDCITEELVTDKTKASFMGPYGYVFENVTAFAKPVYVTPPQGAVIWWPLSGKMLDQVLLQAGRREIISIKSVSTKHLPAPKNSLPRGKLVPSEALASIIGSKKVSFKEARNLVADYVDARGLYDEDTNLIKADAFITPLMGKKQMALDEFIDCLLNNLTKVA